MGDILDNEEIETELLGDNEFDLLESDLSSDEGWELERDDSSTDDDQQSTPPSAKRRREGVMHPVSRWESSTMDDQPFTTAAIPPRARRGRPPGSRLATARFSEEIALKKYANWENVMHDDTNGPETRYRFIVPNSGPRNMPPNDSDPVAYFKLFFTKELVKMIVDRINRHVEEKIQATKLTPSNQLRQFNPVSVDEMYLVLGMLLNMGIMKLPSLQDYWSTSPEIRNEFFPNCSSRNRFQLIFHAMLHCYDIDEKHGVKGDEIQPIIDYIVKKFQDHFIPFKELSADEAMIGFRGQIQCKQHIPKKPTKQGILAQTLADPNLGYLLNIKICYGEEEENELISGLTSTTSAMVKLLGPYLDKGHHIFCDSRPSSLELADYLYSRRTYMTGTINMNSSGIPRQMKKNPTETKSLRSGKMLLVNWHTKRPLTLISTFYPGDQTVTESIRGAPCTIPKPLVIYEYNQYMNGVDLSEQYTSYYEFTRRSVEWSKKLFLWIFEISVTNSYLLYKLSKAPEQERVISLLSYRRHLVRGLVKATFGSSLRKRAQTSCSSIGLAPSAGIVHQQRMLADGVRRRECRFCSKKDGKRKDTKFYCDTCEGKPGLHPGDCFTEYHLAGRSNLKCED